jgi:beta-lactamase class A
VQSFLAKNKVTGIRIDRNERDLQSDFSGLRWQNALAAPGAFDAAVKKIPTADRDKALEAYFKDPRDTAAPAAMVKFLSNLAEGRYLSPASTQKILAIMEQTVTGKDRLKAGLPQNWSIAHKTGTSGSWQGRAATINDVGLMKAPDGSLVAIAVFVEDSRQKPEAIAKIFAKSANAVANAVTSPRQKS